jgi:hypothetical protein
MHNKESTIFFRDLFILLALLALLSIAYKKTCQFLMLHKKSIIHELDKDFADQLYSTQRHARILQNIFEQSDSSAAKKNQLTQVTTLLNKIEEKYKKNSPGLLFLGPIGTASIVLKEQELEKRLLDALNQLGALLLAAVDSTKVYVPVNSIDAGIKANQLLINTLLRIV